MTIAAAVRRHKFCGIPRKYLPYIKFLWMPDDGLAHRIGPNLTYTRTGAMFEPQPDGTFRLLAANELGPAHYINGAVTELEWYAATPGSWTKGVAGDSVAAQATVSPTGRVWQRWTADGTLGYHRFNFQITTPAVTLGDIYCGRLICKDVDQRYLMIFFRALTSAENVYLKIDLTNKTAVSGSDGAHPNSFTAVVQSNADGSVEIDYIWTAFATESIQHPSIMYSDAAWAILTTASGSVDFAALSFVKSPFVLPIGDSAGASYAVGAGNLSYARIPASNGIRLYILKSNHAVSSAIGNYEMLDDMRYDATHRNQFYFTKATPNVISAYSFNTSKQIDLTSAAVMADKAAGIKCAFLFNYAAQGARITALSATGNYATATSAFDFSISADSHTVYPFSSYSANVDLNANGITALHLENTGLLGEVACRQIATALLRISQ